MVTKCELLVHALGHIRLCSPGNQDRQENHQTNISVLLGVDRWGGGLGRQLAHAIMEADGLCVPQAGAPGKLRL